MLSSAIDTLMNYGNEEEKGKKKPVPISVHTIYNSCILKIEITTGYALSRPIQLYNINGVALVLRVALQLYCMV